MYFHYVAIISYLKNACPFIWRNFDSLYSRILRAKLSWNSNSNDSNDYVKNVFKKYIRTVFIGHTFFALSLSLSLSLTFFFICACKSYFKVCRYKNYVNYTVLFGTPSFCWSDWATCATECLILRGKHFRAGITVLMTASSMSQTSGDPPPIYVVIIGGHKVQTTQKRK